MNTLTRILLPLVLALSMAACTNNSKEIKNDIKPGFEKYISGFTSGINLSRDTKFVIRLQQQVNDTIKAGQPADPALIDFDPDIKGKLIWTNSRSLQFIPDKLLESGKVYHIKFNLGKLIKVQPGYEVLEYDVRVMDQSFRFVSGGLVAYEDNMGYFRYLGTVYTADVADIPQVEQMVKAKIDGKEVNLLWQHDNQAHIYRFTIDSIRRMDDRRELQLEIKGAPIGVDSEEDFSLEVPATDEFEVLSVQTIVGKRPYVRIRFSDPLDQTQNLKGLIYFKNDFRPSFNAKGAELKVYPSKKLEKEQTLIIEPGVKNAMGYKTKERIEFDINFQSNKPQLEGVGKGVIMPSSDGLIFPFRAVSLNMVDLSIIQIYEHNVLSFLQENTFDESGSLKYSGRLILQKRLDLRKMAKVNLNEWNTFKIDLSDFIEIQPGAIYRVKLGMRPSYSNYPCDSARFPLKTEAEYAEEVARKMKSWDDNRYYYDDEDYGWDFDWSQRDNPCNSAYYNNYWNSRSVERNIFASNLGIITKGSPSGNYVVIVSDLRTTDPVKGAEVTFYNLQKQEIARSETNSLGICNEHLDAKPYFVVVKNGTDYGYLRVGNSDALSTSNFNVAGMQVQHGLKAYIYGERGVWRPGDPIYLTMILDDLENRLPADYPVIFDLKNPLGQTMVHELRRSNVNGFYSFHTKTAESAPTGIWRLKVKVGGAVFVKSIRVETVKPNRLKAKLDFWGKKVLTKTDLRKPVEITANWLHGSPAKNLEVRVAMGLRSAETKFDKFQSYTFRFPQPAYKQEEVEVFKGKLDQNGKSSFFLKIQGDDAPGMIKAHFVTRVFEKSGDFSIITQDVKYSPYPYYVGLRMNDAGEQGWYATDSPHRLLVATVNEKGEPVSHSNVKISIYKVQWRWWWESSDDDLASYIGRRSRRAVSTSYVNTDAAGKAAVDVQINYRSYEDNGRYLIVAEDPVSGHKTGITVYFSKWYGRLGGGAMGATMLSFEADKDKYKVGEEAHITIPSSKNGRALVSLESGARILDVFWVETQEGETHFSFPLTAEMAPNIFVNISLIQPHAQTVNDNPIRMYGIIPLEVVDPATRLEPQIGIAKYLSPEKEFEVKVTERNGKAMTYTLAIVDEGLLDLTNFRTPDPWRKFYAREALGIRTWDMYDYVIGAYGARLEKAFAIGGDGTAPDPSKNKARRFKPVVFFAGPFNLDEGETANHKFTMPNYIGSVRVMVVAGNQGAYGNAEKAVSVKKDLMLLATLPRVIGPDEEVVLPLTVFAMDSKIKKVKLKVKVNDKLQISGGATQTVYFENQGEKMVYFRLKAKDLLGVAKVEIVAESAGLKARYDVELDVRTPNPPSIRVHDQLVQPGDSWDYSYRAWGLQGTNSAVLEVSGIPAMGLDKRLEQLLAYPHGCIEQTTSKIFPQLFLPGLTKLSDDEQALLESNIMTGLNSLRSFQLPGGGFSYWPGSNYESEWGTSYAGHMLLIAKRKGYALPSRMLDQWRYAQGAAARSWSARNYYGNVLNQAYRLYTLALAGEAELGAMNRLSQSNYLNERSTWMLALAYAEAGQEQMARKLINNISLQSAQKANYYNDHTYGSSLRDKSIHLLLLTKLGEREKGFNLVKQIAAVLDSRTWLSTQSTAFALMAISEYYNGRTADNIRFAMRWSDKEGTYDSESFVFRRALDIHRPGSKKLHFTNKSSSPLYVRVIEKGISGSGMEEERSANLKMSVRYVDMDGNELDPARLPQGTDFKAVVNIQNPGMLGDYDNLALTQIFPSGWEIINTRLTGRNDDNSGYEYRDIRDDRVLTYFGLGKYRSINFTVVLNASYEGKYYLPAVKCEAMYSNEIGAVHSGRWVEVYREQ
jgi:uncharacterized protein YfaS (alpha-2-macroglobulin family)